jgi:hypothetical protein
MDTIFNTPNEAQVTEWYRWLFSLNNKANPFHPTNGGQYWEENNNNKKLIWLAGVTATTPPPYQPSQISNLNAIVQGSQATAVYNDGNGNAVQNLPTINPRHIRIEKGDTRDLYIPISTELATATKWPNVATNLTQLAQEIIDREDVKGAPPAFVEFVDAQGNKHTLDGSQLKTGFRVNGTIDKLDVLPDNVGMNPPGNGPAAFSDYAAILPNNALKTGINTLRLRLDGKFFRYTLEYKIEKM